ncbi:MAG: 1-pyrroline-5-carboxylate dehydrogenase, partial [Calditrichia bacterium]|nr:1-pyrroline-5-carboxylate dehydrogenase [Calditrichia bacterium]
MANAIFNLPLPPNETIHNYLPGSDERKSLKEKLSSLGNQHIEIPLIIGGKEIKTGKMGKCIIPHNHQKEIGQYHQAGEKEVKMAVE